jgi:glutamate-1-semialdehyde 2,1-aminomutase
VLEPAFTDCPKQNDQLGCCSNKRCNRAFKKKSNFLKEIEKICKKNKIVFILDEMITGFRWHLKGAQFMYGVKPDLTTFGKAMANGFSVAAVGGKRKIMDLGSIDKKNRERLFLLSTTHGAEMSGLGAFVSTLNYLKKNNVINKNWLFGHNLKNEMNLISKKLGLTNNFKVLGPSCSPYYVCRDRKFKISQEFRTLFIQEMFKNGVLMPWISICFKHNKKEIEITKKALVKTLLIYKLALKNGTKNYIKGKIVKPVFRKFN